MITCVSPDKREFEDTLETMLLTSTARKIIKKPMVNFYRPSGIVKILKQHISDLEQEILYLKNANLNHNCHYHHQIDESVRKELEVNIKLFLSFNYILYNIFKDRTLWKLTVKKNKRRISRNKVRIIRTNKQIYEPQS